MNLVKLQNIIYLIAICLVQDLSAQFTEKNLRDAVAKNQCGSLMEELDKVKPVTEEMKFNAAICFFNNGGMDKALQLFKEIKTLQSVRWRAATFWEAKIYALRQQDSLTLSTLRSIPGGFLNYKLLSLPEFDFVASNSEAFSDFKDSFKPGFNIWTIILTIISTIGLFIGFLLVFGKSRFSSGEKWLAVVVFSIALILLSYISMWTKYVFDFPYLRNLWPFLTLLIGPSLYFYLKETFKEEYSRKTVLYHFIIPAIAFILILPAIISDFGFNVSWQSDFTKIASSSTILTGHILLYTVLIHFITQNEWQVDTNIKAWTTIISWGMKIYTLAFLSYFILVPTSFFNPQWDYAISMVMGLGILVIAYMGLLQKRVFSSEPISTILSVPKYQSSSLTPGASESIKKRLERLLTEEQVFKENELRLDDLASYLDISRHQLSQVINEHYKVNFFELLNKYRVDYVKKVLSDPAYTNYTIIQIAYEAGFNNKASFNKYFKREMGITPSAYRMKEESVIKSS